MGTIGTVLTPQMPKQVWQADDGSVFDSEEACRKHEETDLMLRDLFDSQTGEKKFSVDYEHMHDKLTDTWNRLNVGSRMSWWCSGTPGVLGIRSSRNSWGWQNSRRSSPCCCCGT